jgi:hypothetical protein
VAKKCSKAFGGAGSGAFLSMDKFDRILHKKRSNLSISKWGLHMAAKSDAMVALHAEYVRQRLVLKERAALVRKTEGTGERLRLLNAAIRNISYAENMLAGYLANKDVK